MESKIRSGDILPTYINPFTRGYIINHDSVRAYNESLQERVAQLMYEEVSKHIGAYSGLLGFFTTGSDGRLEKGPQSKLEIMVLKEKCPSISEIIEKVKHFVEGQAQDEIFGSLEIKDLQNEVLSYYGNNPQAVFPTRIFDMRYLSGDRATIDKAYNRLFHELTGENGRRIMKHVWELKRNARKIMVSGTQSFRGDTLTNYDLDEGVAYFGPVSGANNVIKGSFKYGPLRFVQFTFAADMIRYIRSKNDSTLIGSLPTNIVEKFLRLEAESLTALSQGSVADVVDSYKYFLWLYHKSQFKFRENGSRELEFDKNEVNERIEALSKILSGHIFK